MIHNNAKKKDVEDRLIKVPAKSKWAEGVKEYALKILEAIEEGNLSFMSKDVRSNRIHDVYGFSYEKGSETLTETEILERLGVPAKEGRGVAGLQTRAISCAIELLTKTFRALEREVEGLMEVGFDTKTLSEALTLAKLYADWDEYLDDGRKTLTIDQWAERVQGTHRDHSEFGYFCGRGGRVGRYVDGGNSVVWLFWPVTDEDTDDGEACCIWRILVEYNGSWRPRWEYFRTKAEADDFFEGQEPFCSKPEKVRFEEWANEWDERSELFDTMNTHRVGRR